MEFERALQEVGPFGKSQWLAFLPASLAYTFLMFQLLAAVFTQATPKYRCASPLLKNDSFSILDENHMALLNQSIPWEYEDEKWFLSKKYIYQSSEINNLSVSKNSSTVPCDRWVYDNSVFIRTVVTEFNLVDSKGIYVQGLMGFFLMFGFLLGSTISGLISDRFGRKKTYFSGIFMIAIFGTIVAWSPNTVFYMVFRFFLGLSIPCISVSVFVYGMETAGSSKRIIPVATLWYLCAAGPAILVLFAYLIRDWRYLQMFISLAFLIFAFFWPFFPESPRWLLSKGRKKEAVQILRKMAKFNGNTVPEEMLESLSLDDDKPVEQVPFKRFFKSKTLAIRSLIIYLTWAFCVMTYYGLSLNAGNIGDNIFVNAALIAVVEIPACVICHIGLDLIGRRKLMSISLIVSGCALLIAIFIVLYTDNNWLLISWTMLGKLAITAAFNILYLYTTELFPTVFRTSGLGTSSMCGRIGSVSAPLFVTLGKLIPGNFGKIFPLAVFGSLALISGFASLKLPETTGLRVPETIADAKKLGKPDYNSKLEKGVEMSAGEKLA